MHQRAMTQMESRLYAGAPASRSGGFAYSHESVPLARHCEDESSWLEFNLNTLGQLNTESAQDFLSQSSFRGYRRSHAHV